MADVRVPVLELYVACKLCDFSSITKPLWASFPSSEVIKESSHLAML